MNLKSLVSIFAAVVAFGLISISLQRNIGERVQDSIIDTKTTNVSYDGEIRLLSPPAINFTEPIASRRQRVQDSIIDMKNTNVSYDGENRLFSPPSDFTEPFANRWQRRFLSSESRGKSGGYLFFKHIRKAGGTTLRAFFFSVLEHHDQSRTFDLSPVAAAGFASGEIDRGKGGEYKRRYYEAKKRRTAQKDENRGGAKRGYDVYYVEQEYDAMDWQCPSTDPRWEDSMRVITLRHPIERHFSEFFYSGPGQLKLNKTLLFVNRSYTDELAGFIGEHFPMWMKENGANPPKKKQKKRQSKRRREKGEQKTFGRFYTDNFQLRSLAGCSSKDCLDDYDINGADKERMERRRSALAPHDTTNCTFYFITSENMFEACHKKPQGECPDGCDGPCFYETLARGPLGRKHLDRAMRALESFDAVLIMDRLNDEKQSDFLSDVFGTPRDAQFSLKFKKSKNYRVEKEKLREKMRFYRDLLSKLKLHQVYTMLVEENSLEIELFKYAKQLNEKMIDQWEKETSTLGHREDTTFAKNVSPIPSQNHNTIDDAEISQQSRIMPKEISANVEKGDENKNTATGEDKNPTDTKEPEDAHDYAVIVVHYHKTGYVLTRFLMKLTIELEYRARGRTETEITRAKQNNAYVIDNVDEKTGVPIAFNQHGNWNRNFVHARTHSGISGCQPNFRLRQGTLHLQEAPDFYCSDIDLSERMLGFPRQKSGKTKIVHLVRNPFEMVLSNYFYHSQDPTPEKWVHIDDPCEYRYRNGESLASHVLPTISRRTKITQLQLDAVVTMCQSLYRSNSHMKNATFYEHLLRLNHWDGLRLATAQMIIASSIANKGMAGGDILRMAQNLVKFKNLVTSTSIPPEQRENLHLLTISMDDYIASTKNVTLKFLDFVLGSDNLVVPGDLRTKAAEDQEAGAKKKTKTNNSHVTQGKHEDKGELRKLLRDDPVLGPILSEVEVLVNEALEQSEDLVRDPS